jgi:hypothetical protein
MGKAASADLKGYTNDNSRMFFGLSKERLNQHFLLFPKG